MYKVLRHASFQKLLADYSKEHPQLEEDLKWLEERLEQGAHVLGTPVPNLGVKSTVCKVRLKDSCHNMGSSGGWRIYYLLNKETSVVTLIIIHHKRECENPRIEFLQQKIIRALTSSD